MRYHEKDIDKLEVMPQKISSRRAAVRYWDYYRESWARAHDYVNKVSRDSLVGMHIGDITKKYLHRLAPEYRTVDGLLKALSIEWEHHLTIGRYGYSYYYRYHTVYYIDAETNRVVMRPPLRRRKEKKVAYRERMKLYYETLRKTNKKRREREAAIREQWQPMIDWLFWKRKRDQLQLERQKLIQHGFDPELSFRKHKTLSLTARGYFLMLSGNPLLPV
jgi:hypothetical protein